MTNEKITFSEIKYDECRGLSLENFINRIGLKDVSLGDSIKLAQSIKKWGAYVFQDYSRSGFWGGSPYGDLHDMLVVYRGNIKDVNVTLAKESVFRYIQIKTNNRIIASYKRGQFTYGGSEKDGNLKLCQNFYDSSAFGGYGGHGTLSAEDILLHDFIQSLTNERIRIKQYQENEEKLKEQRKEQRALQKERRAQDLAIKKAESVLKQVQ